MNTQEVQAIFDEAITNLRNSSYPISDNIFPELLYSHTRTSFGTCVRHFGEYKIYLSKYFVEDGSEKGIKNTIYHELLHTIKGSKGHDDVWKHYAVKASKEFDLNIQRVGGDKSVEDSQSLVKSMNVRYILGCKQCGREWKYMKKSIVIKYPEKYRCSCGGHLKVTTVA